MSIADRAGSLVPLVCGCERVAESHADALCVSCSVVCELRSCVRESAVIFNFNFAVIPPQKNCFVCFASLKVT